MKVNVKPWLEMHASISFILLLLLLVIDITRAEDIMADNSLSPRAEDEYYYRHHIQSNGL